MEENSIFVDANIFVALLNKRDASHAKALTLWKEFEHSKQELITSNFVLSEAITVLSMRAGKQIALSFADTVYHKTSVLRVLRVNEEMEQRALFYLKSFKSKNVSFCDCVTFAILELQEIKSIATFDKDFKIAKSHFQVIDK